MAPAPIRRKLKSPLSGDGIRFAFSRGDEHGFPAAHRKKLKPGLPFFLGGEECFCSRETGPVNAPSNFGALDRRAIADAGLQVLFAERPSLLAAGVR